MLACSIFIFIACSNDGELRDLEVGAVKALYEPANGKAIILQASASATAYFAWEPTIAADGGMVLYEIAFDKADGNFSNPLLILASDRKGSANSSTITHKMLNQIAAAAGIDSEKTGIIKWTVFSSKGINQVKAEKEQTIAVTRLPGFADIPEKVYITGEATEVGNNLTSAAILKKITDGEFEVYTQLTAGKTFKFVSSNSGTPAEYSFSGEKLVIGGTSTVSQTGVYKFYLDFNVGAYTSTLVTRIGFFFSPENKILFDLPYIGNGVFQAKDQTVTFKQESWGRDERYKFRMFVKENGGADPVKELEWGTLNSTDSRPTATSPASYYYLNLLTNTSQWNDKWKLMVDFDDVPATYTVYLQAEQPYTHSIAK